MSGKLVIISAPSGAGKTTIVKHLLTCSLGLEFSVSATTRQMRINETDGKDYYFLSNDDFRKRVAADGFVEWQEVYKDNYYGTPKSEIARIWAKGNHVLFDVDVFGGLNLKNIFGDKAISIFIKPPSFEELERRLITRGTDTVEKIRMRIMKAEVEMKSAGSFDYIVINDDLDKAKAETEKLVTDFLKNNP
jgi:guanylate kinase